MKLRLHQILSARGYISQAKYLYGTVRDLERKLGYHHGRLDNGFFVAHLLRIPHLNEFETAGYSQVAAHRYAFPGELDPGIVKKLARDKMQEIGHTQLVKIFPNTRHNPSLADDDQYPPGAGIPQWKLTMDVPMRIFFEVDAGYSGVIYIK